MKNIQTEFSFHASNGKARYRIQQIKKYWLACLVFIAAQQTTWWTIHFIRAWWTYYDHHVPPIPASWTH